jgi:hypothetical protein
MGFRDGTQQYRLPKQSKRSLISINSANDSRAKGMKTIDDIQTLELTEIPRTPGRKKTGHAEDAATRNKKHRLRYKEEGGGYFSGTVMSAEAYTAWMVLKAHFPTLTHRDLLALILIRALESVLDELSKQDQKAN